MCTPENVRRIATEAMTGSRRPSRRTMLAGSIGAAAAASLTLPTAAAAHARPPESHPSLELVLLGTRGGLPPGSDRSGIVSVVAIEGRNYQVDCGYASAWQYQRAGLQRQDLAGIFITHLHADHVNDY